MSERAGSSTEVRPLTKRKRETRELYTRRPEVELQIGKVLSLESSRIFELLENRDRNSTEYLLDETIVYLLREARIKNDSQTIETLYIELNRRLWKLLLKFRGNFKFNHADFEDFGQRVEMTILRKIFGADSDLGEYAQVNFGDFVITEAKGVWKQNLVKIKRDEAMIETERGDEDDAGTLENVSSTSELSAESRLIIEQGLQKLTPEHQIVAAMLLDGFQIESKNANEMTISKHLGVSSRTIRNWIQEMRRTLTGYQGEARQ